MSALVNGGKDDGDFLPGFRFHPTDEELVGFYLQRKVDKKPICLDLIKHIDIYKHDPWDLPSMFYIFSSSSFYFLIQQLNFNDLDEKPENKYICSLFNLEDYILCLRFNL